MARLNCVTVLAPAKLNLALDVVGTLPNGYHDLDMTMQAITLHESMVPESGSSSFSRAVPCAVSTAIIRTPGRSTIRTRRISGRWNLC